MHIMGQDPEETVEIHVQMTRAELRHLLMDMRNGETYSDPFPLTREFYEYLEGL